MRRVSFFCRLNRKNCNDTGINCKVQLERLSTENGKHGGHGDFYYVCEDGFHEKSIA